MVVLLFVEQPFAAAGVPRDGASAAFSTHRFELADPHGEVLVNR
jgi:hypothetical protein